jgi:hypothetical protein
MFLQFSNSARRNAGIPSPCQRAILPLLTPGRAGDDPRRKTLNEDAAKFKLGQRLRNLGGSATEISVTSA